MSYEKIIADNKAWIDGVWAKLDKKLSRTAVKSRNKLPSTSVNGVHNDCSGKNVQNWTNGFWGGLKMLTRNIASEYGMYNIQCNGIGPGYIATPQTAPLREPLADGSKAPFDVFITETKTPAGRWGDPEDLAGPAVFLASSASDFVNGQILYVDGGIQAYFGKFPN